MNAAAKCNEMSSANMSDGVDGHGTNDAHNYTDVEEKNIQAVRSWLGIVYSPKASAKAVDHLMAKETKLEAPTTIPDIHDLRSYANMHERTYLGCIVAKLLSIVAVTSVMTRLCLQFTSSKRLTCASPASKPSLPRTIRSASATQQLAPTLEATTMVCSSFC